MRLPNVCHVYFLTSEYIIHTKYQINTSGKFNAMNEEQEQSYERQLFT